MVNRIVLLLTVLLALAAKSEASIIVVQTASIASTAGTTSLTATFGQNTQAGNLLFVSFATGSNTATLGTDSADTWVALESSPILHDTKKGAWYAANIVGGKTTYAFTRSSSGSMCFTIVEISGCLKVSPFDVSQNNFGTFTTGTTTASSGNTAATAQADEIWLLGVSGNTDTGGTGPPPLFTAPAAGSLLGYVASTNGTNVSTAVVAQIVSSAGVASNSLTADFNGSTGTSLWQVIIGTFKAASLGMPRAY